MVCRRRTQRWLMDCTRYLVRGRHRMKTQAVPKSDQEREYRYLNYDPHLRGLGRMS